MQFLNKRALLIGINYKGSGNDLYGCENDIDEMKNILISNFGFLEENIVVMKQNSIQKDLVPTKANMENQIRNLISKVKDGDLIFFHYSGHGSFVADRNGDEEDGKDETIVPLDYSKQGDITDDWLRKELVDKIPSGAYLTVIADCCHSSSVLDLRYNMIPKDNIETTNAFDQNVNKKVASTIGNVICLSGCLDVQYSADAWMESSKKSYGALTFGLLTQLKEKNYCVDYETLLFNLRSWMKKEGYDQIPQLSFGKRTNMNGFFLFSK